MKKGQVYEGVVESVSFPDKGVVLTKEAYSNGIEREYHVLVKGTLPGQIVKYIVKKARHGNFQGRLLEIVKKSPDETASPVCTCFGTCGGCSYQTLPYEKQIELKKSQVLKLLDSVTEKGSYIFDGIFSSPCVWAYRNKMEFSFGDEYKGGPLALGLHKKDSIHDIVNASGCRLVNNDYTVILDCIREYCACRNIPHYNKNTHTGILRHLLVRRSEWNGEILVALVTTSGLEDETGNLSEKLLGLKLNGTITGFIHIINDGSGDVVKSDETRIIYGKDWLIEKIFGLEFHVSLFSFFQTNTKGAEVLYRCVRNYVTGTSAKTCKDDTGTDITSSDVVKEALTDTDIVKIGNYGFSRGYNINPVGTGSINPCVPSISIGDLKDKVVFDLYSGTGTIAQIIAPVARKVIGVEIVEEAVMAARQNAKLNGLSNCEFIAGDVLRVIDDICEKPDFIILDPPRDGINPKVLEKIMAFGVESIVYISCKPVSLVRDFAVMQKSGYKLERVCCVDMFPQTCHVESIVKLVRK